MAEYTLRIENMHCGGCIGRVTEALASSNGIHVEEVRLGSARVSTSDAPGAVDLAVAALVKAGYPARLEP
jgi:copper chaperone CopZ